MVDADALGVVPEATSWTQQSKLRSLAHTIAHVILHSNYQDGQSEQYIGEWMQKRQNRDEMVIATSQ